MTRKETTQILSLLKAAYPNSYKGVTKKEANGIISMWLMQFANVPAEIVLMAINKIVAVSTFPPSISEVKSKLKAIYFEATIELLTSNSLTEEDRKKLITIQQYCHNVEEPSLNSLISNAYSTLLLTNNHE